MRVTASTISSSLTAYLTKNLSNIAELQNQISSGKKLNKPSDDASRLPIVLELNSRIERNNQYVRNIDDGFSRLGLTETVLNDVSNLIQRAKDLALRGGSDGLSNTDRQSIAIEVNSLIEQLMSFSNKESIEGYLFGGTKTDSEPFVVLRDSQNKITDVLANGNITGKIYRTVGDSDPLEISSDYTGILFGTGNVFDTLIQLRDSLEIDDEDKVLEAMDKLDKVHFRDVTSKISEIGVKANFLLNRKSEIESDFVQYAEQLSAIEDTDIAETIILLEQQLVAYEAALLAGNQILETTLRSVLR